MFISSVKGGQILSMEGHIENFIATGVRNYYINNRFKNVKQNFLH